MDVVIESLQAMWVQTLVWLPRVAIAVAVFAVAMGIGTLVGGAIARGLTHYRMSLIHAAFFRRLTAWVFGFIGLAVALDVVGLEAAAAGVVAGGGVSAIALGFAFRGIGENLLAGLFLAVNRPFRIDDVIQSGEMRGKVRGIELRYTHVRSADGRDIFIPSADIFNNSLVNFTRDGLQRLSFTIGVDYAEDCNAVCTAMTEALSATPGILPAPPAMVYLSEFRDGWVEIEAAFWIDTRDPLDAMAPMRSHAMEAVRRRLIADGVVLSSGVSSALTLSGALARPSGDEEPHGRG